MRDGLTDYSSRGDSPLPSLSIRVSGGRGGGVSTVADRIAAVLRREGFNVHTSRPKSGERIHPDCVRMDGVDDRVILLHEESFE